MADDKIKKVAKAPKSAKVDNSAQNGQKKAQTIQYNTAEGERSDSLVEEVAEIGYVTSRRNIRHEVNNRVILHDASKKPESQMTSFEKIDIIREGISKKDLEHLKEKTELDYNQLSKVLSVARATLINKKGTAKFDMVLSERIVGVADIYSYGYEVFEDENRFNEWIFRSNQSLGGQAPYDLLDNQYGREEVKNLIGRIDYGVYS